MKRSQHPIVQILNIIVGHKPDFNDPRKSYVRFKWMVESKINVNKIMKVLDHFDYTDGVKLEMGGPLDREFYKYFVAITVPYRYFKFEPIAITEEDLTQIAKQFETKQKPKKYTLTITKV